YSIVLVSFFFQAEDGIRDRNVTGVQTCALPIFKNVFYDPLLDALDIDNAQIGWLVSAYAITATICYLPSGFIADRIRVRTLATTGYGITAILTFVYAALPSFGTLLAVFVGMGLSTILIWWGVRFKLDRKS